MSTRFARSCLALFFAVATAFTPNREPTQAAQVVIDPRIEAAAAATQELHSLRFNAETTVKIGASGEPTRAFSGRGAYQDEARAHLIAEPVGFPRSETIAIGSIVWTMGEDGDWSQGVQNTPTFIPFSFAFNLRAQAEYLSNLIASQAGSQTVLTGDIDVNSAIADKSPTVYNIGADYGGGLEFGTEIVSASITIAIENAQNYLRSIETNLTIRVPEGVEGVPPGLVTIVTNLRLSNFNDPTVSVDPPV